VTSASSLQKITVSPERAVVAFATGQRDDIAARLVKRGALDSG
jgi:hypothetical protein